MSLEQISAQLKNSTTKNALPSVEQWDPPFCGDIDLHIKANGDWYYNGTIFKRLSLVKLFASVLKKEDKDYFLVTPVEKVGISVEDAPFVLTQWHWCNDTQNEMQVQTNLGDEFILDRQHPLIINDDGLYVTVRRNLVAKVHRNVYYQWVNLAKEISNKEGAELVFTSAGASFCLGQL